jgi:hypothetical protein
MHLLDLTDWGEHPFHPFLFTLSELKSVSLQP